MISLILISFLFAAIYKVLPDRSLEWGDVAVGAVVTAVCSPSGNRSLAGTLEAVQLRRATEPLAR